MPRGSDEAKPETFEVVERVIERVDFQLAAVTGAGIDRANGKAAAELAAGCPVDTCGQFGKRRIVWRSVAPPSTGRA